MTARQSMPAGGRLRRGRHVPPILGGVVAPWLLSRLVVAAGAAWTAAHGGPSPLLRALSSWDGNWYVDIARVGYDAPWAGPQTPFPFFPLLPWVLRAVDALGIPAPVAGVALDHAAFLLGLALVHELVRGRMGAAAAAGSTWAMALFPGSAPFSFVYPEALLLAFAAGAFLSFDRGHPRRAGVLAALAALARPNGLAVALALGAQEALDRRPPKEVARVLLPAVLAVIGWTAWLYRVTGEPVAWIQAKAAWHEVTLAGVSGGHDVAPKLDLLAAAFALGAVALGWRRMPWSWRIFAMLWILPSFGLGLLGMPRYVSACFPVFAAFGGRMAAGPRAVRVATWLAFAAGLAILTLRMTSLRMMP